MSDNGEEYLDDDDCGEAPMQIVSESTPKKGDAQPISEAMAQAMFAAMSTNKNQNGNKRRAEQATAPVGLLNKLTHFSVPTIKKTRWGPSGDRGNNLIESVTAMYYGKRNNQDPPENLVKNNVPTTSAPATSSAVPMMPPMGFPMGMMPPPGMMFPGMLPPPGLINPFGQGDSVPPLIVPPPVPAFSAGLISASQATQNTRVKETVPTSSSSGRVKLNLYEPGSKRGENDEENELFVRLLYKKLQAIQSRKRLETLHVDIMALVKRVIEEDDMEKKQRQYHR